MTDCTPDPAWCSLVPGEALNCISCDKPLENDSGGCGNQPVYGLAFFTHGHWPSSLFDSMSDDRLEISVCDECLIAKASRQVAFVESERPPIAERLTTVGQVREMLARHDDDVTFRELSFREGTMSSVGLVDKAFLAAIENAKSYIAEHYDEDDAE